MLKMSLVRVLIVFTILSCFRIASLNAQQPGLLPPPQIQIVSRTATLILTLPDGAVVKIAPGEEIPPIPWGTKISAVFGQASIVCGNYRLNLLDGGVVKPFFDKDNLRTTIIVPPESATPVTITVGRETAVLDKGESISIIPGSTERQVRITVVKGEVEITGPKGQFVLGEGASTSIVLKEEKAEQPKKPEKEKAKEKTKEKKKPPQEKDEKDEEKDQDDFPQQPFREREEASPSSP